MSADTARNADTSRDALHRIARELDIPTSIAPCHIATQVIKRTQHDSELVTRLQKALETANARLEILGDQP